jgi:hypothetical protein
MFPFKVGDAQASPMVKPKAAVPNILFNAFLRVDFIRLWLVNGMIRVSTGHQKCYKVSYFLLI